MKKVLSVLLTLCMLLSLCVVLASCGAVSEKDMEKDPQEVISSSLEKSINAFFEDKAGADDVLKKAAKKGKYTVMFASEDLLGGKLTEISETIYTDTAKKQFVSETQVEYNGEKLSAFIYGKDNKFAVSGESIFRSDIALLFNPKTFVEKFAESGLAEMTGIDDEQIEMLTDMVKSLMDEGMFDSEKSKEKAEKLANDLIAAMNPEISTEKLENEDGAKQDYIVSTYTINNETVKKMANIIFDFAKDMSAVYSSSGDIDIDDMKDKLDEALDKMDDTLDFDVKAKVYVDSKEGCLYLIDVSGEIEHTEYIYDYDFNEDTFELETILVDTEKNKYEIDAELRFTSKEISLTAEIEGAEDEPIKVEANLTKEVDGGDIEYKLVVNVENGSVTVKVISASYKYEADGDIRISVKIPKEIAGSEMNVSLKGKVTVEKDKVTLKFDVLNVGDEKYRFDLVFTAESVDSIPEFPKDAKDIVDISEKEWEQIVDDIEDSDLAELIKKIG